MMEKQKDVDFQNVIVVCPICKSKKEIKIPQSIVKKKAHMTTISIEKGLVCKHPFQAFIDKNFKVRGYQRVDFELKIREKSKQHVMKNDKTLFKNLWLDGNYLRYDSKEGFNWIYLENRNTRPQNKIRMPKRLTQGTSPKTKNGWSLKKSNEHSSSKKDLFQDGASYYQELVKRRKQRKGKKLHKTITLQEKKKMEKKVSGKRKSQLFADFIKDIYRKEQHELILQKYDKKDNHEYGEHRHDQLLDKLKDIINIDTKKYKRFIDFKEHWKKSKEKEVEKIL
ncbi:MAG: hypothetical protein R6U96_13975 [Promethearchaeia archaeon]